MRAHHIKTIERLDGSYDLHFEVKRGATLLSNCVMCVSGAIWASATPYKRRKIVAMGKRASIDWQKSPYRSGDTVCIPKRNSV